MGASRLLYLSRADVERVALDMAAIIGLLDTAFREKGEGRVEMPPKPAIHPRPESFIHAMPASIPALRSAGVKWVSGYPANPAKGLPYISGLLVFNDDETGLPLAVMDGTWITAHRTGAATALAARHLARPESETVGILGCGVQGRTNLRALATLFPVARVLAYDVLPEAARLYAREMTGALGVPVTVVTAPRDAVVGAELVVTAGPILKHPTPTIGADWLQPGAFASAVDYDSYWKPEALSQIDKLATDDLPQFQYARETGYFQRTPAPYASLDEIVTGRRPGREHDDERTMAMNLGLALDDMAVAPEIYRRAVERGVGTWLEL
jgi:ornithine cyclodeaminase/alanine dehydrogenase-like protein (mu-crystallin family)